MRIFVIRPRLLAVLGCLVAAVGMFWAVNNPAVVGVASTQRQLPIYCVQRDQKMASLSFDAAWGDVIIRPLRPNALRGRSGRVSCQNRIQTPQRASMHVQILSQVSGNSKDFAL